jgi:hypothetical protein
MSDIVERLRASYEFNGVEMLETAADTIIRLTAENDLLANDRDGYVQLLTDQNTRLTAGSERLRAGNRDLQLWFDDLKIEYDKLRAALRECEAALNAYYRMEYPSDHPYSQKELAQAMASNPATVALEGEQA